MQIKFYPYQHLLQLPVGSGTGKLFHSRFVEITRVPDGPDKLVSQWMVSY